MTRNIIQTCLVASAILVSASAVAGSLENLERERSIMVSHLLDADLNVAQRQEKIAFSKRRLADLERTARLLQCLVIQCNPFKIGKTTL